jgi:hypothetical protein
MRGRPQRGHPSSVSSSANSQTGQRPTRITLLYAPGNGASSGQEARRRTTLKSGDSEEARLR